jgi:hypothetical protein
MLAMAASAGVAHAADAEAEVVEELIVTGTRSTSRTVTTSLAPSTC